MLTPGQAAPDFSVPDSDMQIVDLVDLRGKNVVLYFYPKDDTTGCTIEALEFTDLMDDFADQDAVVLGVSKDNCVSHAAFRDKHGLSVQLLADIEGELCEKFDVWREKEAHGEKKMGILRSTFVIDKQGVLRHALYDVKPKGHAAAVLELLRDL
jgi:peroxiredoxin